MNTLEVVAAAREMMALTLLLATPFLLGAVAASLLIGLLQASTRMNDLTLSFVPRFFAVLLVAYVAAAWTSAQLTIYLERAAMAAQTLRE
jgi:flagellar biosynthetic protein FliQ